MQNPILGNPDFALSMLANSGPSPQPRSFGQILGSSALEAQNLGVKRQQAGLENLLTQAQIAKLMTPTPRKPIAVLGDDGKPVYVDEQEAPGRTPYSMGNTAELPRDIQMFNLENEKRIAAGQKPFATPTEYLAHEYSLRPINPTVQTLNNTPTVVQPTDRRGNVTTTPLSDPKTELDAASNLAGAKETGVADAKRTAEYVDAGMRAADQLPVLKRTIELLDNVETGGIDNAKLWATNFLGVTGADEAELSANMGKAVLAQLRPIFGAQFTAAEGDRLTRIEAGFGKSTAGNIRLINQALEIAERAARRGMDAAEKSGDTFTAKEIKLSMEKRLFDKKKRTADEILKERRSRSGG